MKNSAKRILSMLMALAMLMAFAPAAMAADTDASALIHEDFDMAMVWTEENPDPKALATPLFISDYQVNAWDNNSLNPISWTPDWASSEVLTDNGETVRRFVINDTDYVDSVYETWNPGKSYQRAITYRPKQAGEATTRDINGVSTGTDSYVPYYVGNLANGTKAPENWIFDNWGFNGFRYFSSNETPGKNKDFSAIKDTGYAIYNVMIESSYSLDGVYLALTYTDPVWWVNPEGTELYGHYAVGVPVADYYDVAKGGYQTIKVPLSAFNLQDPDVFVSIAYGAESALQNDYENYRLYNNVMFNGITGMGIIRNDVNKDTVTGFAANVKNLAIVDTPESNVSLIVEYDEETETASLEWTGSGYSDTTYTVVKKTGLATETVDVADALSYTDTNVPKGTTTYTVVANIGKYDMTATSNGVDVTKGVAKTENVVKMDFQPNICLEGKYNPVAYYRGPNNGWNDYEASWVYPGTGYKVTITDNNGDDELLKSEQSPITANLSDPDNIKSWGGTKWAYDGIRLAYSWDVNDAASVDAVPDEHWGNVMDISSYMNGGYAVFEVEVGENNTTTEGIYLALTCAKEEWAIAGLDGNPTPVTKERYPNMPAQQAYATSVIGVDLADYYDFEQGGSQEIKVPLSKFVSSPDFVDMYGKAWGAGTFNNVKFVPGLFSGMGIVKDDKDDAEITTAEILVKSLKIAGVAIPEKFVAADNGGKVEMSWEDTADIGVTYQVVKKYAGTTEYLDAGTATYFVDENVATGSNYTYSVVAVDAETGIKSAESNAVTIKYADSEVYASFDVGYNAGKNSKPDNGNVGIRGQWAYDWWSVQNGGNYTLTDGVSTRHYINDYGVEDADRLGGGNYHGSISYGANYGFNGYRWSLGDLEGLSGDAYATGRNAAIAAGLYGNVKDISAVKNDAYVVYDIDVETDADLDDVYLALSYISSTYWFEGAVDAVADFDNLSLQQNITGNHIVTTYVGVPLKDYYDETIDGYQQVIVPLSAFETVADGDGKVKYNESRGNTGDGDKWVLNQSIINSSSWAWSGNTDFRKVKGLGLLRVDNDDTKLSHFYYDTKGLAVVKVNPVTNLKATLDGSNVNLTWDASTTENIKKYEISRNGEVIGYAENATSYVDTDANSGNNTYEVKAVSFSYDAVKSAKATASVNVPVSTTLKLYAGTGASKVETSYIKAGDMTVEAYSSKAGNTLYAAKYDAEGKLLFADAVAIPAGETKSLVIAGVAATDVVKGFIWDANYAPVQKPLVAKEKPFTVLAIGDEYVTDATANIEALADVNVAVTTVAANGANIADHLANYNASSAVYTKYADGASSANVSLNNVLAESDWDAIVIQLGYWNFLTENNATLADDSANLINAIKTAVPGVEVMVAESWACDSDCTDTRFVDSEDCFGETEMMMICIEDASTSATGKAGVSKISVASALYELTSIFADDNTHLNETGKNAVANAWIDALIK